MMTLFPHVSLYILQLHLISVQFCQCVKECKYKSLKKYTLIFFLVKIWVSYL